MKGYIVCVGEHGRAVLFGRSETEPVVGQPMPMNTNLRMVLYWDAKCGGLFGLCTSGPKGETRITAPVLHHENIEPVKQWMECSEAAALAIEAWKAA